MFGPKMNRFASSEIVMVLAVTVALCLSVFPTASSSEIFQGFHGNKDELCLSSDIG
jgi:hypothetical protein